MISKIISRATLVMLGSGLSLVVLEIVLRITGFAPTWNTDQFLGYYVADEEAGHDIARNIPKRKITVDAIQTYDLWSNELGCFDLPFENEERPILLIGDSYTHAVASFESKWGTVVESVLAKRVLKCGVGGYGPKQEVFKAKKILKETKAKPQLIIVGYLPWNDIVDDLGSPNSTVINGYMVPATRPFNVETGAIDRIPKQELLQMARVWGSGPLPSEAGAPLMYRVNYWLNSHSSLVRTAKSLIKQLILSDRLENVFGLKLMKSFAPLASTGVNDFYERLFTASKKDWFDSYLESHLGNFLTFKDMAVQNDGRLLVVVIPTKEEMYPFLPRNGWSDEGAERIRSQVFSYFKKHDIAYLDLLPVLKEMSDQTPREWLDSDKDFYWRFDSHWSGTGNKVVGFIVSENIIMNNLATGVSKQSALQSIKVGLDSVFMIGDN